MASSASAAPGVGGLKKKERTRRQLVRAAVEEIALAGEAFTVLDVTRRAEVANGTFYNHFVDRDALVDAVVAEIMASFVDRSDELVGVDDPVVRFATITALLLEHSAANPKLATVMLRLQSIANRDHWPDDPFRQLREDLLAVTRQGRVATEPGVAVVDLVLGTLFQAVLRITTVGADAEYRAEVIRLLLVTLGVERDDAREIATEAVATAPDLDAAYGAPDPRGS